MVIVSTASLLNVLKPELMGMGEETLERKIYSPGEFPLGDQDKNKFSYQMMHGSRQIELQLDPKVLQLDNHFWRAGGGGFI